MARRFLFCITICASASLFASNPYVIYRGHSCGMFSAFLMVVGLLDKYDRGELSGVEVALGSSELYFDKDFGPNWWEYYFSPICTNRPENATQTLLTGNLFHQIALIGHKTLSRDRGHELISKYIRLRPEIVNEVNLFLKKRVKDKKLIGIHYRGTDKFAVEARPISPQKVCRKVMKYLKTLPNKRVKIFVATDSEKFLNIMQKIFKKRVVFFDMKRSNNNSPLHTDQAINGYMKGKMALLDCLVLSKCDLLIRTSSNLSNASMLFNPNIPVIRLNDARTNPWAYDR